MTTIYTLKTCDTCKKALKWLDEKGVAYKNHDVRADGLSPDTITNLIENLGWEVALNRRSTTWRGLSEVEKADPDNAKAIALIEANPTLLKRPVFLIGETMIAGFDKKAQAALEDLALR